MQLEKPKLFPQKKSFVLAMLFLLSVILVRLGSTYHSYQDFISKPFYFTDAKVMHAYTKLKGNKEYQVLKLRSEEGLTFYTSNYTKEDFAHQHLRIQIFPNETIMFWSI